MKKLIIAFIIFAFVAFASTTPLASSFAADPAVSNMESKAPDPVKPSSRVIRKAKLALVWCTNNLTKLRNKQMHPSQVKGTVRNYYSKREELDNYPEVMQYVPKDYEKPAMDSAADREMFDNKSFREIIEICDTELMTAHDEYFNSQFKPSNIAEKKIATFFSQEEREKRMAEQEEGKKRGFEGVTYGMIDTVADIRDGKYSIDEVKKFLIKPDRYDGKWVLTNILDEVVAYETWDGSTDTPPAIIIVIRNPERRYTDGDSLPVAYYQLHGETRVQVSYQGTDFWTNLLVLQETQ